MSYSTTNQFWTPTFGCKDPLETNTSRFILRINMTTHWLRHSKSQQSTLTTLCKPMHSITKVTNTLFEYSSKFVFWQPYSYSYSIVLVQYCLMLTKNFFEFLYIKIVQTFWKYQQFPSYNSLQPNTNIALMIVQMNREASFWNTNLRPSRISHSLNLYSMMMTCPLTS